MALESLSDKESQLLWEESIQRIKKYLESLSKKRSKRKIKNVSDVTTEELSEVMDDSNISENSGFWPDDSEDINTEQEEFSDNDEMNENMDDEMSGGMNDESEWWDEWQGGNLSEDRKKSEFDLPPEDQDEYIPRDSEFGEAMWEQSRFAEIYPPFLWYYVQWKKSYFNRETNLWSKKKRLSIFVHKLPEWLKKYAYTWVINSWINAIPLPDWARPETDSLHCQWKYAPEFQVDQNWCVYLVSKEKQFVSFNFWLNQYTNNTAPIKEDNDKIVFDSLSTDTQQLLNILKTSWGSTQQKAAAIKAYILKNKKYSTKVQGTLRNKSNRNNYIKHLDESPILECFSANSLFVALCRELWIPAKLVVWHMVQSANSEWKACITKNDWHAWSEIWDETIWSWVRVDSTPTEMEDWKDSKENWQEQNNNNQNADNNFGDNQNQQSWDKGQQSQQGNQSDSQSNDQNGQSDSNSNSQQWNKSDSQNSWESDNSQENSESSSSENDSNSNSDNNSNSEQNSDSNADSKSDSQSDSDSNSQKKSDSDNSQNQSSQNSKWDLIKPDTTESQKSPAELLDEMVEKAKEDSLLQQSEKLKDALDKLEKAHTKEEIKDILDKSDLSDFAKDMIDKVWEDKILDDERKEIEKMDDESKINEALQKSLLSDEYKQKLKNYADIMKKKIEEEKKRMKSEMEKLGFSPQELWYYKEYKELEKEVEPEVRKQVRELQKILPVQYQIVRDDSNIYRSGPKLDGSKLAEFVATWDPLIFKRNKEVRESNEINMFETIIIDTSWSMGGFTNPWSILRESIKAAIIRAKVLEHFKVDFSIVLFGDHIDEVMSFDEKFSSKWKCLIPSKLIRAAHKSGWNSREPISYVYENMLKQFKKHSWKSFGNISFIWDGDLYNWTQMPNLKAMIEDLRRRGFWVTAYYINDKRSSLIDYYFGKPEDWNAVYAWDSKELSKEIIEAHKTHLKKKIKKYMK